MDEQEQSTLIVMKANLVVRSNIFELPSQRLCEATMGFSQERSGTTNYLNSLGETAERQKQVQFGLGADRDIKLDCSAL